MARGKIILKLADYPKTLLTPRQHPVFIDITTLTPTVNALFRAVVGSKVRHSAYGHCCSLCSPGGLMRDTLLTPQNVARILTPRKPGFKAIT